MPSIQDQIKEIEDEIHRTPYHKGTQHHIGKLKAKLAKLKEESRKKKTGVSGKAFAVPKGGNATVSIVGFPGVGKSTLLNQMTEAKSEVGDYQFTTLKIIPGVMEYKGARIQMLDMPGLVRGASKGRGRGREVISVVRSSDMVLLMLDVFETNLNLILEELNESGLRLNQKLADIVDTKKDRGGINVFTTTKLTKIDTEMVGELFKEWGYINADIVVRENVNEDQIIDWLAGNRVYIPAILVLNKVDLVTKDYVKGLRKKLKGWRFLSISAKEGTGLSRLRKKIYDTLELIRIYMKPQGKEADYGEPLVLRKDATIGDVCDFIHRDFQKKFRYANVWGNSAKFPGQRVGLTHVLIDKDVVTVVVRK
ncbi:MAG: GTP-binding protein [Methanobacteriota archaeon]|nr:MAG: GTP-binding protein [Euryarchaeota archaeon]